jgi:hypothetical protein
MLDRSICEYEQGHLDLASVGRKNDPEQLSPGYRDAMLALYPDVRLTIRSSGRTFYDAAAGIILSIGQDRLYLVPGGMAFL